MEVAEQRYEERRGVAQRTPDVRSASVRERSAERSHKITTRNLDLFYGQKQALCSISIDIPEHEVTAFIGPSGCGKSTYLRTINRMNDLIAGVRITGSVQMDGIDIYQKGLDVVDLRKRVGMVFQKSNPFPKSIWENVAYGPKILGTRQKARLNEI